MLDVSLLLLIVVLFWLLDRYTLGLERL